MGVVQTSNTLYIPNSVYLVYENGQKIVQSTDFKDVKGYIYDTDECDK